jgi:hypothetical protein
MRYYGAPGAASRMLVSIGLRRKRAPWPKDRPIAATAMCFKPWPMVIKPMDGSHAHTPVPLGEEIDHYWLVQRMAKATGVDLVRATEAGLLEQEEWADIVTRCRGCQWADGCDNWLSKPVDESRALPEPCLNRNHLAALQDALDRPAT